MALNLSRIRTLWHRVPAYDRGYITGWAVCGAGMLALYAALVLLAPGDGAVEPLRINWTTEDLNQ